MSTTLSVEEDRSFEIGRVLSGAFNLIGRKPLIVLGLALLCGAIPTRLFYYAIDAGLHATDISRASVIGSSLLTSACAFFIDTFVAGALIGTAIIAHEGGEPDVGSGLRLFLQRIAPLVGVALLYTLGCLMGMVLLLVPMFFLIVRWAVVGPVAVMTQTGVSEAFGRSSALTEGVRLKILGLLFVAGVLEGLAAVVWAFLTMAITGVSMNDQDFSFAPAAVVPRLAIETATIAFSAAIHCGLYIALKERLEGPMSQKLAEIFG